MKILGLNITKSQKNSFDLMEDGTTKRTSLSELVKRGQKIKISRDVFYEIYIRNGDVRACIRDIAKRVGIRGIYLEKKGQVVEAGTSEIAKIFKYPTWLDFKVELFKHLLVGGEAFIVPVYDGFKKVRGFNFLDPRTMVKFYNKKTGEITRFEQRVGMQTLPFTKEEIAYFQFEKSPNNNYEGLSILEGIVYDALTDKEAMEKNYEFFEGGMMLDGFIRLDPEFDADELEIAKEKLTKELAGKGRKMLISNTIQDVKTLSVSPKDLDGINQRKLTTEKICAAIGVPKFIIGYTEGVQRANGDASYRQYIEGTIQSNQDHAEFILNTLYTMFVDKTFANGGTEIKMNGEKIEDRKVIEEGQRADIERGIISIDEARKERGYDPWNIEGATNAPLIATNIQVLTANADTPAQK